MRSARLLVVLFILSVLTSLAFAQEKTIVGTWMTIDDETGDPKSYVSIYEKDGKFYGKIDSLIRKPGEDPDPVCDKCPDDDPRKDQKILGMEIIKDMEKDGDEYKDGTILDPKKGKVYDCKLWIEDGKLKVRGYLLFFFRTQTWHPVES
jgi:uncharacterized protein (DUF2147 family)